MGGMTLGGCDGFLGKRDGALVEFADLMFEVMEFESFRVCTEAVCPNDVSP